MTNIIIKGVYNYDSVAREQLNATHSRIYFTRCIVSTLWGGERRIVPFSTHYFNSDDVEVGYYVHGMVELCGLSVFETPRVWSDEFKMNIGYGKPVHLVTKCVTNSGYIGENKQEANFNDLR